MANSYVHIGKGRLRPWLTIHNPSLFTRKTSLRPSSLATVVTPLKILTVFGCWGSVRSIKRTDSVGRVMAEAGIADGAGAELRSGTKAIARVDPGSGKSTSAPAGCRKTSLSASNGLAGSLTFTIAK